MSECLQIERIGPQHQAGSDSLLTGAAFFKMRELYFDDHLDDQKYLDVLYGLGTPSYRFSLSLLTWFFSSFFRSLIHSFTAFLFLLFFH